MGYAIVATAQPDPLHQHSAYRQRECQPCSRATETLARAEQRGHYGMHDMKPPSRMGSLGVRLDMPLGGITRARVQAAHLR